MLERLLRDLRHAVRVLLANPLSSLVVVLSLAVGIGVNTTAFTLLNAMALRDLPGVRDQDRLVTLGLSFDQAGRRAQAGRLAWTDVEMVRAHPDLFSGVAAAGPTETAVDVGNGPRLALAEVVSGDYFRVLRARPALGRLLVPGDDHDAAGSGVVLSHRFWRTHMAADPDVVGRTIRVNGRPVQVVGVGEEGFTGMTADDVVAGEQATLALWVPLSMADGVRHTAAAAGALDVDSRWFRTVGRLADGTTLDGLAAALPALAGEIARAYPEARPGAELVHGDLIFGPGAGRWRPSLTVLGFMVVPLIVLLVACANAANLLLARAATRRRELSVRKALGATRSALVRQLLAESVVLAAAAGVAGLLVALGSRRIAAAFAVHLSMDVPLDWRVFTFALVVSVATGLIFGLVPALWASRVEVRDGLTDGGYGTSARGGSRLRDGLVVVQVALGLVLLVASGLFVESSRHGLRVESGIDEERLLLLSLDLGVLGDGEAEGTAFWDGLLESLRAAPGMDAVALAGGAPLEGYPMARVGTGAGEVEFGEWTSMARVGDGFVEAAGLELRAGRSFVPADVAEDAPVALVNEAAARRLWPESAAAGLSAGRVLRRTLRMGEDERLVEVVGVVSDSRTSLYRQPEPIVYLPRAGWLSRATVYMRTAGPPERTMEVARAAVADLDPRLPVRTMETAEDVRRRILLPWRLAALGMGVLGGIAVALAAAGLYGVLAYTVTQRTREIGVRMAMGADRGVVVRGVLADALRLAGTGLLVGFGLAAVVAVSLRHALFGVSPLDPSVYGRIAALLAVVAVLAAAGPARRVASVEPAEALRA